MQALRTFDTSTAKLITRLPDRLHKPFTSLEHVTSPPMWGIYFVLYAFAAQNPDTPLLLLVFLPLATISKLLFKRQRPPTIYAGNMRIKSYSFPSSHAYAAALMTGYFGWVCLTNGMEVLAILFGAIGVIVGISRVYIGAHYPSDVLAGWLFGLAAVTVVLIIS